MIISIGRERFDIKDCRGLASVRGLMFDKIEDYDGALIYANSIWMPFVRKSLQLVFADASFKITSVQGAVPMTLDARTWRTYTDKRARYCIELAKKAKAKPGMKIKIYRRV